VTATLAPIEPATPDVPPSLTSRFFTRRTVASLIAAGVLVAFAVARAPINWGEAWRNIRGANPLLYLTALVVFYSTFLIRAVRWRVLLRNAGEDQPALPLVGIIVTSFFVNCVVPAKMGDVYRAYLARVKRGVSAAKALGTVIAERLVDLCVLMGLLLIAGAVVFHRKAPGVLIPYVIAGTLVCCAGVGVILMMRAGRGQRLLRLLPEAVFHRYESFRIGTVHSLGRFPTLITLTGAVWGLESARLAFVVFSLGYGGLLGPSQFLLVALAAALLTTVPFLPGGLGLVEFGMVTVLVAVGGITKEQALSIAILDRSISYGSLIALGFVVFLVTHVHTPKHHPAPSAT